MFSFTYSACQSPGGNQNPMNFFAWNPKFHIWSGDFVYNDSIAVYDFNGYTMNPSVFWNTQTDGAPIENANTAARTLLRFEKHYGRTGLTAYSLYWQESDKRGMPNYFQCDDHDMKCNNWDNSLLYAQKGFPMPGFDGGTGLDNSIYGQVSGVQNLSQALTYIWDVGVAGFQLLKASYAANPPVGAPNGDVPKEMQGTAAASKYNIEYFYRDFDANGNLVTSNPLIRVIFWDCISYKNAQGDTDNASKHMLGLVQEEWAYQTALAAKNAGAKMVIISSTKDLYNLDNSDSWYAYSTRRDILLTRLHAADIPFFVIGGDKHVPHVGMARVANGQAYDCLCVTACPFGQGVGGLTQYKENVWFASRNDQCVFAAVTVDDQAQVVKINLCDAFDNSTVWSCEIPFGSRIPSKMTARPYPAFVALPHPDDRTVVTVGASPQTITNSTNRNQIVNVVAGTFTAIDWSEDSFTTSESLGITQRQFVLRPNDAVKLTSSVAPTAITVYNM